MGKALILGLTIFGLLLICIPLFKFLYIKLFPKALDNYEEIDEASKKFDKRIKKQKAKKY